MESCLGVVIFVLLLIGCDVREIDDRPYEQWKTYNGDPTSSSYSSLDQINKENVQQLEVAWVYHTGDLSENARSTIQTNPIIIDGVLYGASPRLKVFAVDAKSGEEKWIFDPFKGELGRGTMRSVVYWEDGSDRRILFSAGNWLYSIKAENGKLISEFGNSGRVSLLEGLGRDPNTISVRATSPGIIYKDLLIHGSAVGENYGAAPGHIRAYDVRTGETKWTFHTIPQPGEPGAETWHISDDELQKQGGVNNWTGMSLDINRGIVYIPLGSPVYDFYGGDRIGQNLYGNSLLALEAETGEYIWHYQTVRHDLWDYDLPAPPNLLMLQHDGQPVEAVAQVTKQGFTFVFDRVTGKPLFPIEDRPVPVSYVDGEQAWPTQPFPLKPVSFVRQGLTIEDITDRSPIVRDSALAEFLNYRSEGLYTPPDSKGTIHFPSTVGGANWGGAAHDPQTGVLYINANELPEIMTVTKVEHQLPEAASVSLYDRGALFYHQNCAMCHGNSLEGQHPVYPGLTNLEEILSQSEALKFIEEGGGLMPGFPTITEDEKKAIIAFLFNRKDEKSYATIDNRREIKQARRDTEYRFINTTAYRDFLDIDGYPAINPPWGTLNAINLNTGEIEWQVPLGSFPELEKNGLLQTGRESWGGPIVTAGGLVFIAGTGDQKFRAFDKDTGEVIWETTLPAAGFATPATYVVEGRQYIVIAAGGGRGTPSADLYIAFSLPEDQLNNDLLIR